MEQSINIEILKVVYSKRKPLGIMMVAAVLLSVVFSSSYFLRPKFKSTAVVYPANMAPYSEESPTEQLIQFMSSFEVRQGILEKFNLAKHYRLDTADSKFDTYYNLMFAENVKINQTRYESVEIEVLAFDKDTAKLMVEGIIELTNALIRKSHNEKTNEFVVMHSEFLKNKTRVNDSLRGVIESWGLQYGLLDYYIQTKEASKNYYKALSGNGNVSAKLDESLKNLFAKGPQFLQVMEKYKGGLLEYNEAMIEYNKTVRDLNKEFSYTTIISKPNLPDAKFWPKRGIIVMFSVLGVLVLGCVYFIYIDRLKQIKSQVG